MNKYRPFNQVSLKLPRPLQGTIFRIGKAAFASCHGRRIKFRQPNHFCHRGYWRTAGAFESATPCPSRKRPERTGIFFLRRKPLPPGSRRTPHGQAAARQAAKPAYNFSPDYTTSCPLSGMGDSPKLPPRRQRAWPGRRERQRCSAVRVLPPTRGADAEQQVPGTPPAPPGT